MKQNKGLKDFGEFLISISNSNPAVSVFCVLCISVMWHNLRHLCKDVRLYPDANLNASVCLFPLFLIYVSQKRLIIDGASIVISHVHVKYFAQGTTKLHKSL